mgnify:CR=1 FL=1
MKRAEFQKEIETIDKNKLVYIDEAGVDNRIFREYARAPRGEKITAAVSGKTRERHSMIGGWIAGKFVSPFTFQGGCNADVFNIWLKEVLLPVLPLGTTIVADNASFHKTSATKNIIETSGFKLKFLPPYSPDLNPIEHCWHTLKSKLRPMIQNTKENFQNLIGECLLTI